MSWLKLTNQALYLMRSGSDCLIKKVAVSSANSKPLELRLYLPLDWFSGRDVPGGMEEKGASVKIIANNTGKI